MSQDPRVKYFIFRSGVFDFKHVYGRLYDINKWKKQGFIIHKKRILRYRKLNYLYWKDGITYTKEKISTLSRKIAIPTLIINGTKDDINPLSQAKQFYKHLGTKDKTLTLIEGADHFYNGYRDNMQKVIVDWVKEKVIK